MANIIKQYRSVYLYLHLYSSSYYWNIYIYMHVYVVYIWRRVSGTARDSSGDLWTLKTRRTGQFTAKFPELFRVCPRGTLFGNYGEPVCEWDGTLSCDPSRSLAWLTLAERDGESMFQISCWLGGLATCIHMSYVKIKSTSGSTWLQHTSTHFQKACNGFQEPDLEPLPAGVQAAAAKHRTAAEHCPDSPNASMPQTLSTMRPLNSRGRWVT